MRTPIGNQNQGSYDHESVSPCIVKTSTWPLEEVGRKHKVTIRYKGGSFRPEFATLKVEVAVIASNGQTTKRRRTRSVAIAMASARKIIGCKPMSFKVVSGSKTRKGIGRLHRADRVG